MRVLALVALAFVACAPSAGQPPPPKQCTDDTMCPMATPHCNENFQCVGCIADLDCTAYPTTPHCETDGTCVACIDSTQCTNPAPVCDAMAHDCRMCKTDDECVSQVCDLDSGSCVSADTVLYATPNGTDVASCLQGSPCSLTHALSLVYSLRPIVRMLPGTYTDALVVNGTMPMTVQVVGTGALLGGTASGTNIGLLVDNGNTLVVRGVTIAIGGGNLIQCKAPAAQVSSLTLRAVTTQSGFVVTQNCTYTTLESDFKNVDTLLDDGTDADIERSWLGFVRPVSTSTFRAKFVNSIINQIDLGSITQPAFGGLTFSFNTFYGSPIDCTRANLAQGISFVNNIIVAPGMTDSISGGNCTFDTNVAFPQTAVVGINTIKMDPNLGAPGSGDFHLNAGSPAIDAARPTPMDPSVDYAGTTRPQGPAWDIGAYEFKGP